MPGTVTLQQRRPVQVLHEGRWLDGWLEAYRREPSEWRGCVRYSAGVGMTCYQWRGESELRRPP
jgi:hypothetical protein